MDRLPDAPAIPWTEEGTAAFGTFRGECLGLPFAEWFGRLDRVRAEKRWLWCGVMAEDVAVGLAIVRTGYAANVFCWVFDRQRGEFLEDVSRVLPLPAVEVADTPPPEGVVARYRAIVEEATVTRDDAIWTISGGVGDVTLDLEIRETGVPITAICPVDPDDLRRTNITRKQGRATAIGTLRAGTAKFTLAQATGFVDHSHGMLSGETAWQWAIGAGRFLDGDQPVAFNLVASFNDGLENVIWIGDEPTFAGQVTFELPDEQAGPWHIHGDRIALTLEPEAVRAQELDLGVIASDYLQPLGCWRGTIDGREVAADGVAELHRSVW